MGDESSRGLEISSSGMAGGKRAPSIDTAAAGPVLPSLTFFLLIYVKISMGLCCALSCMEDIQ